MNVSTTVWQEHGMTCPKCRRDDRLEVAATIWVHLVPDGTEDSTDNTDQTWDFASPCLCNHADCGWRGNVGQAREATEDRRVI